MYITSGIDSACDFIRFLNQPKQIYLFVISIDIVLFISLDCVHIICWFHDSFSHITPLINCVSFVSAEIALLCVIINIFFLFYFPGKLLYKLPQGIL